MPERRFILPERERQLTVNGSHHARHDRRIVSRQQQLNLGSRAS
jgi:hypothetical protein